MLVYNKDSDDAEYAMGPETRATTSLNIEVPPEWYGDTLECYLAFRSEKGEEVSNSLYLGPVVVDDPG